MKSLGGLSPAERAEYNRKADRIHVLESTIQARALANKSSQAARTNQRRQWKQEPKTETPQTDARQSYRSREKDSADAS
jgi:hypothetical protein